MIKSISRAFLLLGAAALWPLAAQAQTCDLTTAGTSCTINGATFTQGETMPAGSDQIAFVRIGDANQTSVQGYNTSGRPVQFNEITDLQHTHDLLVSQLQLVDGSYMFLLDINQIQSADGRLLSLDQLQVFGSNTGGLTSYPSLGTLIYDMDAGGDNWVKLSNNVGGGPASGSGDFDMTFTLSAAQSDALSAFSHVYLFSQFGTNLPNNDGYEEWVAVIPEPSVAWLLALGLLVVALRRAPLGLWRLGGKDLTPAAA